MLHFFKKIAWNTFRCHYQNLDMIYSSSKYRAKQTEIGNLRSFFALYHPKNPKNPDFVNENLLEVSSFYTCAPKIRTILWCTILEIRSERNEKFCIFEPFFALLSPTSRSRISKFQKKKKKWKKQAWRFYPFIHSCLP